MSVVSSSDYSQKYLAMVKEKILELARDSRGTIFLFGSRARGDNRLTSDVDVGFDHMSHEDFIKIERKFRNYWEESLIPYDIDLVYFPDTKPAFSKEALKDRVVWKED